MAPWLRLLKVFLAPFFLFNMKSFRLQAKHLFLTYPQCSLEPTKALEILNERVDRISQYVIAREQHKDGTPHLHVYLCLDRKIHIRDPKFFDLEGHHGNYQSCRSAGAVLKYVTKDGIYITNMDINVSWGTALSLARRGDASTALQYVQEHYPREYCIHGHSIQNNLRAAAPNHARVRYSEFHPQSDFTWTPGSGRVLWLWGPSGCGKTQFAKFLLGRAFLCRELDSLREFDADKHSGFILDDLDICKLEKATLIALTDMEDDSQIKCRYSNARIPAGTPRIVTSNSPPSIYDLWFTRRIQVYEVTARLWLTDEERAKLSTTPCTVVNMQPTGPIEAPQEEEEERHGGGPGLPALTIEDLMAEITELEDS